MGTDPLKGAARTETDPDKSGVGSPLELPTIYSILKDVFPVNNQNVASENLHMSDTEKKSNENTETIKKAVLRALLFFKTANTVKSLVLQAKIKRVRVKGV